MINRTLLEVDLNTGKTEKKELPLEVLEKYPGGRGLGVYLLTQYGKTDVEPLAAKSPFILTAGLFANTAVPSSVEWFITERSSLTGGVRGSFAWGDFGIALHSLGYAAVVVTGKADKPVYLYLEKDTVQIREALIYWGMDTQLFTKKMKELEPKLTNVAIGRGGEEKIGISCAVSDGVMMTIRGGGAIMGSKMLKAVVIRPDDQYCSMLSEKLNADGMLDKLNERVENNRTSVRLRTEGKAVFVESKNLRGDWPTENFQKSFFESVQNFNAEAMKKVTVGTRACKGCKIGCIRITHSTEGVDTEGPELEPIWALSARIGNASNAYMIEIFNKCLQEGIETSGFGGITAFIMECSQRGLIREPYQWGKKEDIEKIWKELLEGTGIGGALRDGSRNFCKEHPECLPYAMQGKGVELSAQEPRQSQAFGLAEAVSPWGACCYWGLPTLDVSHNIEAVEKIAPELLPEIMEVENPAYKANLVKIAEEVNAVSDSFGICKFACPESYAIMPEDLAELYSRTFDKKYQSEDIMRLGERIVTLERLLNLKYGIMPEEDGLPERFYKEPLRLKVYEGDRLKGLRDTGMMKECISHVPEMLKDYYRLHDWENGIPTEQCKEKLGLSAF